MRTPLGLVICSISFVSKCYDPPKSFWTDAAESYTVVFISDPHHRAKSSVAPTYVQDVIKVCKESMTKCPESHSRLGIEETAIETDRNLEALLASCVHKPNELSKPHWHYALSMSNEYKYRMTRTQESPSLHITWSTRSKPNEPSIAQKS